MAIHLKFLYQDGECCLDRFYGGYFPDWSCGGQWQNMMGFLSALFSNCRQANVHLAIFYNGAIEPERFPTWVHSQLKRKQHVKQVLKHLTKRMTPPPKVRGKLSKLRRIHFNTLFTGFLDTTTCCSHFA